MNDALLKIPTAEEILETIRGMHPTKAPGPNDAFSMLLTKLQVKERFMVPEFVKMHLRFPTSSLQMTAFYLLELRWVNVRS